MQIHGFGLIKRQIPESGSQISERVRVTLYLEE
ncbi:PASTA domain-containing protein [bacterium]|nr:PASTA domain-containing protein [bacterium]